MSGETSEIARKIDTVVYEMQELHRLTGLPFFANEATAWRQWLWMLNDRARAEWGITRPGHHHGQDDTIR